MLLDFGMALSTAVLIADRIKSVYLSMSLVEVRNLVQPRVLIRILFYLVWLVDEFLCG